MPRQNLFVIALLGFAGLLNFLGAFGPEVGFDALWYHLTIPKLYLERGTVFHIPGGLLYYSELPRLTEMAYLVLFKVLGSWAEAGAHLLNWAAGVGSALIVYRLARKFLPPFSSLFSALIFYAAPLVGWLSGSAYVDLPRTFFEILALYLLLSNRPGLSGVAMGLAMSTKTLAIGSFGVLLVVAYLVFRDWKKTTKLAILAILVALPWYILAFINTGNPLYPIGAGILDTRHTIFPSGFNPLTLVSDFWKLFMFPEDPTTPIYVIIFPFLLVHFKSIAKKYFPLILYALLGYLIWWITPRTGGGRFILPYLPVFAILATATIESVREKSVRYLLIFATVILIIINLGYRGASLWKLKPYFLGEISKEAYLCGTLDPKTSVFVDCEEFMAKNIQKTDLVLVKGVHNLYYVNFPFVHETWYNGEKYNYVMTDGEETHGQLVYQDPFLLYRLYKL